jgi:hypothetical protein
MVDLVMPLIRRLRPARDHDKGLAFASLQVTELYPVAGGEGLSDCIDIKHDVLLCFELG